MPFVFDVVDPEGVRVVLEEDVWINHISERHPDVMDCPEAMADTIHHPTLIYKHAQSRLYFKLGACDRHPNLYLQVVVKEPGQGDAYTTVRTAHFQATPPSKGELIWMQRN